MEQRVDYMKVAPGVLQAMLNLEKYLIQSGLERVARWTWSCLRASQINGCAYCIDMHWKDLKRGRRDASSGSMDSTPGDESPYYSDRERAALAWTDSVTNLRDEARAGRGVRTGPTGLHGEGTGRPDPRDRGDQRLESPQHRVSATRRDL